MSDEIALGTVTRPQGLRGEVRVHLNRDGWVLLDADAASVGGIRRVIEMCRGTGNPSVAVFRFQGIDDRDAAEALRNAAVSLRPEELPQLAEGELWEHQVVGTPVYAGEQLLGEAVAIANYGASDLLVVHSNTEEWFVPLIDGAVQSVSSERIVVVLPAGLEAQPR